MNPEEYINDADLLLDMFEERAAIMEYEARYPRTKAEQLAAECYGFDSKWQLLEWVKSLKESSRCIHTK